MHLLDIVDIFSSHDYEVIIRATQAPKDAYEKAKEYADSVDLIVCSGGDGTLDEVVTGITEKNSNVPIGYIPAGSTNDFANSLFMPKSMVKAAQMIMEEKLYHCDIGRFNSQTFAYVAAFGLFTDVSYETDQDLKNVLGHVAYLLEGVKRLFDIKPAIFCTPVNASLSKLYFIILKSVRTDQIPTVCIDVKRNIIRRPVKYICQIFCQNIFAGGFWSGQKQILSLQDPCNGHLQNIFSIKWNCRFDNSVFHLIRNGIYFPKLYNFIY